MKNVFNSFLKLYNEYGNLAWGAAPKTKTELINRSIKHSIITTMDTDKFDFVKPFYEYLKMIKAFNKGYRKHLLSNNNA